MRGGCYLSVNEAMTLPKSADIDFGECNLEKSYERCAAAADARVRT